MTHRAFSPKGFVAFAAAVTVTVAGVGTSAGAAPSAAGSHPGVGSIAWGDCGADLQPFGAQCGFLSVPLDYDHPGGAKIQLAVSRVKHTVSADKYQGVMLVNPGGPGNPGLNFSLLELYIPNGAGDAYDWIGFEPRGVGASKPALTCDPDYSAGPRPDYVPWNARLEKTWLQRSKAYAEACRANGPLLQHMTTIDSAKDLESIRSALGVRQIGYFGFSYGTYLGQVYSSLYPQRVRRMVLDSNVDPRRVWYSANLDQDVAFQKNIRMWFDWLADYDSVYHLGRTAAAVEARFYLEQNKLRANPAGGVVGPAEWTDIFLFAGYHQQTWSTLGTVFAAWAGGHDDTALLEQYQGAAIPDDDNRFAVYHAVECTDAQWPRSWKQWRSDQWRIFPAAPIVTWANAWYNAPCLYWPAKAGTPATIDGSQVASALLVAETQDAATPYPGSLEVRRRYPHSSLIAVPGGLSHADSLENPCVAELIAGYLLTGELPARQTGDGADTTCAPLPVPVPAATSLPARVAVH